MIFSIFRLFKFILFWLIKFHCTFPISQNILTNDVYCILIRIVQAIWIFFPFVNALLLSILTSLFLPSSSVNLSYFILVVPTHECVGKHSCMRSFLIAILNGTCFFSNSATKSAQYAFGAIKQKYLCPCKDIPLN